MNFNNKKSKLTLAEFATEKLTAQEQNEVKGGSGTSQDYIITIIQP